MSLSDAKIPYFGLLFEVTKHQFKKKFFLIMKKKTLLHTSNGIQLTASSQYNKIIIRITEKVRIILCKWGGMIWIGFLCFSLLFLRLNLLFSRHAIFGLCL